MWSGFTTNTDACSGVAEDRRQPAESEATVASLDLSELNVCPPTGGG